MHKIAIVDPYSSGAILAGEFIRAGVPCIRIRSTPEVPDLFRSSRKETDFAATVEFDGDANTLARQLGELEVTRVLAGCDLGVRLADDLGERLGVPNNGTRLSVSRSDKYRMMDELRRQGVRVPAGLAGADTEQLLEWRRAHCGWPVIVKPPQSTASDGVTRCRTEPDLTAACGELLGRVNALGRINERVLVQEYLAGEEYIVDTVSHAGCHRPAAFWKYGKPDPDGASIRYHSMKLLPYRGPLQEQLFGYICRVLDALEVRYGPAHSEVILTDRGPVLVETGTRLSAGINAVITRECSGVCQLDLTLASVLDPERFLEQAGVIPELRRMAANYFLMPPRRGILQAMPRLAEVRALPSLNSLSVNAEFGHPPPRIAGLVSLLHDQETVVDGDLRQLRLLEQNGLYAIDDAHDPVCANT